MGGETFKWRVGFIVTDYKMTDYTIIKILCYLCVPDLFGYFVSFVIFELRGVYLQFLSSIFFCITTPDSTRLMVSRTLRRRHRIFKFPVEAPLYLVSIQVLLIVILVVCVLSSLRFSLSPSSHSSMDTYPEPNKVTISLVL